MKLEFEKWLDEQEEIKEYKLEVFNDAVNCFKHGIYRPALMLSYIGFMFVLKDRFLEADKPEPYTESSWDEHKKDLRDDSKWEKVLTTLLFKSKKTNPSGDTTIDVAPFNIDQDTRNQITYWKDRRNDCAHYKNNEITESHVIAFWSFLKSKLPFITVEGGTKSVINKINRFYDISYTPLDANIASLIRDISKIIKEDNYKEIFHAIAYSQPIPHGRKNILLPYFENEGIKCFLIKLLQQNKDAFKYFILCNPEKISCVLTINEDIRHFWNDQIEDYSNSLKVYAQMLIAELIPTGEIDEANKKMLEMYYDQKLNNTDIIQFEKETLLANGFYKQFNEIYLSESFLSTKFEEINSKTNFYVALILLFKFNKDIVKSICMNIREGKRYPYVLNNRIKEILQGDAALKESFKSIVDEHSFEMPTEIEGLYS